MNPDIGPGGIRRLLPHRHPMLLIDRVVDLAKGERLTALKAVTCNEPWYSGLPDDTDDAAYAWPESLLIESWCQAAAALMAAEHPSPDVLAGGVMLFGGMSQARFTGTVRPGDVLVHHVRLTRSFEDTATFEGESTVHGETVMEVGQAVIVLRPAGELAWAVPAATTGVNAS